MPKTVLMDEFHLKVFVPTNLTPRESKAIRRVLNSRQFQSGLIRAIRRLFRQFPFLAKTRVKLTA